MRVKVGQTCREYETLGNSQRGQPPQEGNGFFMDPILMWLLEQSWKSTENITCILDMEHWLSVWYSHDVWWSSWYKRKYVESACVPPLSFKFLLSFLPFIIQILPYLFSPTWCHQNVLALICFFYFCFLKEADSRVKKWQTEKAWQ